MKKQVSAETIDDTEISILMNNRSSTEPLPSAVKTSTVLPSVVTTDE